jgi:membrane fusion protein, multidrug efflux system
VSLKQKSTLTAVLSSIAVVAAVLAAGAGLVGFKVWQFKQMAAQDAPPEAPISVTVAQALPVSFRQHSSSIGTLVAAESITLSSEIAGTVVKIDMLPGAIVETGSVLVQLDISLEAAQLESAKAAAMIARSRLTRTRDAFKSGAVTPLEMDEAEGQFLQSQAAILTKDSICLQVPPLPHCKALTTISMLTLHCHNRWHGQLQSTKR